MQRKMVNIDILETSGVDHPAHGFEGWIVQKAEQGPDGLPAGARELTAPEENLVSHILRDVGNARAVEFEEAGEGTMLGKTAAGKPFIITPADVEKAASRKFADDRGIRYGQG